MMDVKKIWNHCSRVYFFFIKFIDFYFFITNFCSDYSQILWFGGYEDIKHIFNIFFFYPNYINFIEFLRNNAFISNF